MQFQIHEKIFSTFQGAVIGVLFVDDVSNEKEVPAELTALLDTRIREMRSTLSLETLSSHPLVDTWRRAYARFGVKPKDARSSIEALCRSILNGRPLRSINTLVDAYNLVSLHHMLPLGGEDLEKVQGNIELTFASAEEAPVLLLGDKEPHAPTEGEVIYKDDFSAICRRWNWREADRTKLGPRTRKCIMVAEALPPATREDVAAALSELSELITRYCGGRAEAHILTGDHSVVER